MSSFSLHTAIFMSVAVSALTMLVLFFLQRLKVNAQATGAWASAFACLGARHFCSLMIASDFPIFAMGVDFFLLGFASFLWVGTRVFNQLDVDSPRIMLWFASLSLWVMVAHLTQVEFFWRALPVHLAAGAILVATAHSFWRTYRAGQGNPGFVVLAMAIALKGVHLIDFPFLRDVASFAPLGFLLGAILDLSIGMLLLVVSLMGQQKRADQFHADLKTEMDERKRAEDVSRERESLFEKVFQLVPDVLIITREKDGRYVEVNQHWETLTGYSRTETLGKYALELGIWVELQQRDELLKSMQLDGEVRNRQASFRHKDGRQYTVLISGTCFAAGGESFVMYVVRDVTALHEIERLHQTAEVRLRENEHKYSMIFQLSPIPMGLINSRNSSVVEVNDSWVAQFGYVRAEVIGNTALEINFWSQPQEREKMMQMMRADGKVDRFEGQIRSKSGALLTCLVSVRMVTMHGENVFLFSMLDVTRQYQVEKEIREMTTQLEARVRQRTLKLEQANNELGQAMASLKLTQNELIRSEKMAALGALVAGVAHELNTPIGNSVTVASTLQDKTQELLRDVAEGKLRKSLLDQYLHSASTGTAILMRSLGVARDLIGSFKQVAVDQSSNQRRLFDLKLVLEENMATLSPMYKKGPYALAMDLNPGIQMDSFPGPLGQIFTNFMTNALSHAFDGRATGKMQISSHLLDAGHVEIIFSDDGVGISDSDQKRVFDPFFTTKLGQGGSGLGMHIAYNLVTGVLGGTLDLVSQVGQGTRFAVRLPLSAPEISLEQRAAVGVGAA